MIVGHVTSIEAYGNKDAQAQFYDDLLVEDIYERLFSDIANVISSFYACKIQLDSIGESHDQNLMIPEGIYRACLLCTDRFGEM